MIRKITPIVTWVPWKPVIMKKLEPNWSAPHGLPQGRTPSMISLVHSKPCIPTNVAPNAAVASINAALLTRSWRYPKLTAIAIVPLLLIKMKVMMAIRMRGMVVPPIVKAKTSLGFGQGTVVDIRTVMYDSRKQLKMNVSLRRKIHIMALPQDTFLNARWSEDQSATMPVQPGGRAGAAPVSASTASAISLSSPQVQVSNWRQMTAKSPTHGVRRLNKTSQ